MKTKKTAHLRSLETAAVGPSITRHGVSFFPVYLLDNNPPAIATGPGSRLTIDELPSASVPTLTAKNPTPKPILIPQGEQFVGGSQNRTANVSILVPPKSTIEIPVSCLESGRWGDYRGFDNAETYTPRRVRAANLNAVAASMRNAGSRRGDQQVVWGAVDDELAALHVASPTSAVADANNVYARDESRAKAAAELVKLGPLPSQCGIVVAHGNRVVAAEIFGASELLKPHWPALIRSHLLETSSTRSAPSATRALRMIQRFATATALESLGVGLGTERHVRSQYVVGHAITLDGALVHASVFPR